MKKYLFLVSVAALTMTSCSDQSTEFVGDKVAQQAREIAFAPLAKPTTRANAFTPVSTSSFPDNYTMEVSANVTASSSDADLVYFSDVSFAKGDGPTWKGGQYWPLSASTLNFLAVTNWVTTPASVVSTAFTTGANTAVVSLGNNAPANLTSPAATGAQHDLMYAVGRGIVSQSTNAISYTGNAAGDAAPVDMVFKHALAWVNFTAVSNVSGFTLNSITLNDAYYGGTYTLNNSTNSNYYYDGTTGHDSRTASPITGTWSTPNNQNDVAVPGWSSAAIAASPSTPTNIGNGLVIVPTYGLATPTPSFTGFTISYTFNGQNFTYTYTQDVTVEQAKKYTYAITFNLTEIEINPSVTTWDEQSATAVAVPGA